MANEKLGLTRDQLSTFLKDHEQIRQFERLFEAVDSSGSDISVIDVELIAQLAQSTANQAADTNHLKTDYIDFDDSPPHSDKVARMVWSSTDDTINLHHTGGVTQQLGLETYILGINQTASTITNGSTIGFAGVNGSLRIEFSNFIADGTVQSEYFLGVATQDIGVGGVGRVTVFGNVRDIDTTGTPVGEVWLVGDELYASWATAGTFTNVKPTAPNVSIPVAVVIDVSATIGQIFVRPIISQQIYYGEFSRNTDDTAAVIDTAYPISLTTVDQANGISIGAPASRIVVANSGLYNFSSRFQLLSNSASAKNARLWYRKNGVDIANSAVIATISDNAEYKPITNTSFFSLQANDYIELMWAVDNTGLSLKTSVATAYSPAIQSISVSITQVTQ
tara:strand:+ start:6018 stop:7196 length:1179 start_codon:yes stop_codon:yes gene_type:complete